MGFSVLWDPFECGMAAAGGLLIALASTLAFVLFGRITGISGIYFSNVSLRLGDADMWKMGFLFGLNFSAILAAVFLPTGIVIAGKKVEFFDPSNSLESSLPTSVAVLAGFLVGFGTKLSNGCTSGHGVCGLARLSPRSFLAVSLFMSTGVLVSTYLRELLPTGEVSELIVIGRPKVSLLEGGFFIVLLVSVLFSMMYYTVANAAIAADIIVGSALGFIFGVGLLVSGMARQSKIFAFLTLGENWNPALMLVMLSAVGVNLITFQFATRVLGKTLSGAPIPPVPTEIDWKLVTGALFFGAGWGIGGLCPGPVLMNLYRSHKALIFLVALTCGQFFADRQTSPPKTKIT